MVEASVISARANEPNNHCCMMVIKLAKTHEGYKTLSSLSNLYHPLNPETIEKLGLNNDGVPPLNHTRPPLGSTYFGSGYV